MVCLWLPTFRIKTIQAAGPDSDGMQVVTQNVLSGTYHYVFPRDSIFFFPENEIRAQILQQYPDISAVAIARTSLGSISIASIPRQTALVWCGENYPSVTAVVPTSASTSPEVPTPTTSPVINCYDTDSQGVIFAIEPNPTSISAETIRIYAPLAQASSSEAQVTASVPLGSHIIEAGMVPNALRFVKVIKSMGVPIVAFAIRVDEADMYTQSGTRITYVLGREEMAKQLAESAFPSLNLGDGSLEYVDLRFDGKVYFKKVGGGAVTTASSTKP